MEKNYKIEIVAFGKKLRQLRRQKDLTQLQLELESGLSRTEISKIEKGQKNIEFMTMVKLAKGLNIKVGDFFK